MDTKTPPTITKLYKGKVEVKFFPDSHIYMVDGKRCAGVTTFLSVLDKSEALKSYVREQTVKRLLPSLRSVGHVTEEELVAALFEDERNTKRAADMGTAIHAWVESYIRHRLKLEKDMPEMPEDPATLLGVTSFIEWESEHKVKYLWTEKVLYSKKFQYIGTGDFGAKVDGKLCLCDIKTGNDLYNSVRAQTAAYAKADEEESGVEYEGRWAIRIAKEMPEEYAERMALKNEIRSMLKKDPIEPKPYQVFEAKRFDADVWELDDDFRAFISHLELYRWNQRTSFYKR